MPRRLTLFNEKDYVRSILFRDWVPSEPRNSHSPWKSPKPCVLCSTLSLILLGQAIQNSFRSIPLIIPRGTPPQQDACAATICKVKFKEFALCDVTEKTKLLKTNARLKRGNIDALDLKPAGTETLEAAMQVPALLPAKLCKNLRWLQSG